MGRYVYEDMTSECVWKYVFGEQPSEQCRIATELYIGTIIGNKSVQDKTMVCHIDESSEPDWNDIECDLDDPECNSDVLIMNRDDILKLKAWAENNVPPDDANRDVKNFYEMVVAYHNHMVKFSDIDVFYFRGEY